MPSSNGHHPVRIVSQRTGLTPDVLRAWERRYGAVSPIRSPGGQRHYSDADIERLSLLSRASRAGRQIGQLVPLPNEELQRLIESDERQSRERVGIGPDQPAVESFLSSALMAVEEFDAPRLEQTLRAAVLRMPSEDVLDQVIGPLLFTVGSLWHQGLLRPANEHLATSTIRRVLVWMSDLTVPDTHAPVIIVGTPASQLHELGAMLAATTAASCGWRVAYLGPNLPADELARAVQFAKARALALSIVYPTDDPELPGELRALRAALPTGVGLVIGGSGAAHYADAIREIGAHQLASLAGLRQWLRQHGVSATAGRALR
ncbi:MAG: MerR family transcriptional regulator [Gemmatimonadaceae bacterium]|nr:MerR family transcriptional regulator [Gemmatimonadaceae bacterium]MCW5826220.1 MerR family transcriptional regulator [Gemmatimonadaceae bacterium]